MKSFTASVLMGLASAQSLWESMKADADNYFGNGDGELTFEEITAGIEELGGASQEDLMYWYGEDHDWESDEWFLTDQISNQFDENWDGLCLDECMAMNEHLDLGLTMEEMEYGMEFYDMNDDGLLSIWEQDEIWHDLKEGNTFFGDDETMWNDSDLYEWDEDGNMVWDCYYCDWYYDDYYYDWDYYMDWYYDDWDWDYYMDWYYDDWCWDCYYDDWYYDDWYYDWDYYMDWYYDDWDWDMDWYYDDWCWDCYYDDWYYDDYYYDWDYYMDWYGDDWDWDWYGDDWDMDWYGDDWDWDWYGDDWDMDWYGDDWDWDWYGDDWYYDDWYGDDWDWDWYGDDWDMDWYDDDWSWDY